MKNLYTVGTLTATLLCSNLSAQTLISNDFDVGTDVGPAFQQITNGLGSGSADPSTGVITSGGLTGIDANSAYGLNTSTTVDASAAAGFTIEWVVSSMTFGGAGGDVTDFDFNGFFFGVTANTNATGTTGPSLWNNNPDAVGISLYGDNPGTLTNIGFSQGASPALTQSLVAVPTTASLLDGFTISFTVNSDNTWSASSTGLSTNIANSGTLNAAFGYADIADNLVAYTSAQGDQISYTIDQVTLTAIPEPGIFALFAGVLGFACAINRRRK